MSAKNSSTGTGWVVVAPEVVISLTPPGSSTTPLVPPTLAYSDRKTDWSGKMLHSSPKMSLNCHNASSRKQGGPAIGKT